MKQKILMLGWGYPPNIDGGLDIHVAKLFSELRENEVEVDLALPEERAPDQPGIIPLETESEDMMAKARDISSQVVELAEDYDIIHTHDWFGAESGLKAKKYSNVKWVSTIHSTASGRTRGDSRRIKKFERGMAERSDIFIAVSQALAEEVENEYSIIPEVIENGYSKPKSTGKDIREELNIDNQIVFYVGRHAEQKGIELLMYGFKKLLNDRNATLVIGGDGGMRQALEEFAEILNIEENVIFTGFIPDEELGDYYRAADVFVSPSINEPFGLTITEALETGTPVVATRNGAQETLPDNAIIDVSRDSDSIRNGIEKAFEKDELPDYEGRDWCEVAEETLEVYQKLT